MDRVESSCAKTRIRSERLGEFDPRRRLRLALLAELGSQSFQLDGTVGTAALVRWVDVASGDRAGRLDEISRQRDQTDPTHLGPGLGEVLHDDRLAEDVAEGRPQRLVEMDQVDGKARRPGSLRDEEGLAVGTPGKHLVEG